MQKRRAISAASISFAFALAYVVPCDVPSKTAVPFQPGAQVLGVLKHLFSFFYPYRALQFQLISSNIP
jgi:urease beta subunit